MRGRGRAHACAKLLDERQRICLATIANVRNHLSTIYLLCGTLTLYSDRASIKSRHRKLQCADKVNWIKPYIQSMGDAGKEWVEDSGVRQLSSHCNANHLNFYRRILHGNEKKNCSLKTIYINRMWIALTSGTVGKSSLFGCVVWLLCLFLQTSENYFRAILKVTERKGQTTIKYKTA